MVGKLLGAVVVVVGVAVVVVVGFGAWISYRAMGRSVDRVEMAGALEVKADLATKRGDFPDFLPMMVTVRNLGSRDVAAHKTTLLLLDQSNEWVASAYLRSDDVLPGHATTTTRVDLEYRRRPGRTARLEDVKSIAVMTEYLRFTDGETLGREN
jgi:hypothetical protein